MGQLTKVQRYEIQQLAAQKCTQAEIALKIGVHPSTVCRELKRNVGSRNKSYSADLAQRNCDKRHKEKPKKIGLTPEMKLFIDSKLAEKYSPEQIVGYCRKHNIPMVSHERIYQYVWADKKQGGTLYAHMRNKGKRYRKRGAAKDSRGIIPGRVPIADRPAIVEKRKRFGDFEVDTVIGKRHDGALVTLNDRATGLLKMRLVSSKEAAVVAAAIIEMLAEWKGHIHTITSDNGKEFANHVLISNELGVDFYFAKPYHSWQRGSNENLNGLIRQYFPKETLFADLTAEQVKQAETALNSRPRKRLGYVSPLDYFYICTNGDIAFIS